MKKTTDTGEAVAGCVAALVVGVALDFLWAGLLQIVYNAVAPTFHWPTVGYWTAFYIVCGLSIVGGFFKSSSSK